MTDQDLARRLRDQLDAATRHTPGQPAPAARVTAGRRALRRRRAATGVAGLAAVTVLATGAGVAWTAVDVGAPGPQRGTEVAGETGTPSEPCPVLTSDTDPATTRIDLADDQEPRLPVSSDTATLPVDYDGGGELSSSPGFRVLQHLEGPDNSATSGWDAVEVEGSNGRFFQLLGYRGDASSATAFYPVTAERDSLAQWVTYRLDVAGGAPDLVRVDEDGLMSEQGRAELWAITTADVPGSDARSLVTVAEVHVGSEACYVLSDVPPAGPTRLYVVPPEYADVPPDSRNGLTDFAGTARAMLGGETV